MGRVFNPPLVSFIVMIMIKTRTATKYDYEFIRQVHHLAYHDIIEHQFGIWDEDYQNEFVDRDLVTDKYKIILSGIDLCGYYSLNNKQGNMQLTDFAIHPKYQSKGIGGIVLEHLIEQTKLMDSTLSLGVFKMNNRAQRFYEKHGFKISGETAHHFLYKTTAKP
jgi:ribosomal protein S18 acetylase RimI-like enzyme